MRVAVFSTKPYDRRFLEAANVPVRHSLTFLDSRLTPDTVALAGDHDAVCVFVNDQLGAATIHQLASMGIRLIALRCAGFNNVDLHAAHAANITVVRVPAYSPHAVAEHTIALILTLNRKVHRAFNRVREGNFSIDGLLGFDLKGRTVGVVGTGRIGAIVARLLHAFGCKVLAHDVVGAPDLVALGVRYTTLDQLVQSCDIISLHCPLTPDTRHLIDAASIARMKSGVMLINTSRGALVDTKAVIEGLKSGQLGYVGLDVYEEEADVFFEDLSSHVMQDDTLARLLTFHNVLITSHQAFFTEDAMRSIARTTLGNISGFEEGDLQAENRVHCPAT
jgi:D-lactate dehydrogenase